MQRVLFCLCGATGGGGELCGWGIRFPEMSDKSPDGECTTVSSKSIFQSYVRGGSEMSVQRRASLPSWAVAGSARVQPFSEGPCVLLVCDFCHSCLHKDQSLQCAGSYGRLCGHLSVSCLFSSWHYMVVASLFSQPGWLCVGDSQERQR